MERYNGVDNSQEDFFVLKLRKSLGKIGRRNGLSYSNSSIAGVPLDNIVGGNGTVNWNLLEGFGIGKAFYNAYQALIIGGEPFCKRTRDAVRKATRDPDSPNLHKLRGVKRGPGRHTDKRLV